MDEIGMSTGEKGMRSVSSEVGDGYDTAMLAWFLTLMLGEKRMGFKTQNQKNNTMHIWMAQ